LRQQIDDPRGNDVFVAVGTFAAVDAHLRHGAHLVMSGRGGRRKSLLRSSGLVQHHREPCEDRQVRMEPHPVNATDPEGQGFRCSLQASSADRVAESWP
jgi:hypothetical protein